MRKDTSTYKKLIITWTYILQYMENKVIDFINNIVNVL